MRRDSTSPGNFTRQRQRRWGGALNEGLTHRPRRTDGVVFDEFRVMGEDHPATRERRFEGFAQWSEFRTQEATPVVSRDDIANGGRLGVEGEHQDRQGVTPSFTDDEHNPRTTMSLTAASILMTASVGQPRGSRVTRLPPIAYDPAALIPRGQRGTTARGDGAPTSRLPAGTTRRATERRRSASNRRRRQLARSMGRTREQRDSIHLRRCARDSFPARGAVSYWPHRS